MKLITCITLFIAVAGLGGCGKSSPPTAAPPAPTVLVSEVQSTDIPIIVQVSGTVQGSLQVAIKPRVSGTIEKRLFIEGREVKEGDPLYQIDPRPFQAQLDAAQAQLAVDQANLEFAEAEVERYTKLARKGAGSVEKKQDMIKQRKQAQAAIAKDKANIEQAQLNLGYTLIKAPFAGVIQATRVYKGAVITAQQTSLTELVSEDPVHVIFAGSRQDAFKLQQLQKQGFGAKSLEQITARYELSNGSLSAIEGHLDFRSTQLDPNTDTFIGRAVFANPGATHDRGLIPGQYVPLYLTIGHRPNTLLIPQTALMQSQEGDAVYVVGKDDKVERRAIEVHNSYKDSWIVRKGLKADERVIYSGTQKIRKSGMTVKIGEPADKKGATADAGAAAG
jgi:membrane fusion protein (multidrug efflux system)